jgi:glutamyl-tRNA reductase
MIMYQNILMNDSIVDIDSLLIFGVSHHSVSLEFREKLAEDYHKSGVINTLSKFGFDNGIVIATCNRFEIITVTNGNFEELKLTLTKRYPSAYLYQGEVAIKHILRVCSGLDSMVIGETQISAQLNLAYQNAIAEKCLNKTLHYLIRLCLYTSKKVHQFTSVGSYSLSIVAIATKLAEQVFGKLSECSTLILGSGNTAKLMIAHLQSKGTSSFIVANRTVKNAEDLASEINGKAIKLSQIDAVVGKVDLIVGNN